MTISTIEESEIPEFTIPFTLAIQNPTLNSTAVVELCAAGHHPKCRITRGFVVSVTVS